MEVKRTLTLEGGKKVHLVKGDITLEGTDAIVNAANSRLIHGGGVARAIVRRGGEVIQEESRKIGFVPEGGAVATTAGRLGAKAVIHAVGPRYSDPLGDAKLRQAVTNSLRIASERAYRSISIPAISSGIFGYPKGVCARILLQSALDFLEGNPDSTLKEVRFTIIDDETLSAFEKEFAGRGQS